LLRSFALFAGLFWGVSELALSRVKRARRTGATSKDRGSIAVLFVAIALGLAVAVPASRARLAPLPLGEAASAVAGVVLLGAGVAFRWLAVWTLGRFFTVDVAIASDHGLVDTGVYRHVRHPAYLGTLVSFAGLGVAFGSWVSLAALLLPIGLGLAYRIRVEERALEEALGDAYRAYRARTWRLVPGIY
jgi:protein-S-isoprenylcysteine O-methyltransferase Ste14